MTVPTVIVHPDAATLVTATAARLLLRLVDAQSVHRPVHAVLTGGGLGIRVLREVATSPLRGAVDWTGVHVWWGDERFLPTGHPDRNEAQARAALLDDLAIPAQNVHPVPAADAVRSPEEAADAYAAELANYAATVDRTDPTLIDDARPAVPAFDVLLLGVGPDGHIASLFPGHVAVEVTDRAVVGVHGSPKPPPERVSLTIPAIAAAEEVWLVVAGADKGDAVGRALSGAPPAEVPAAVAQGRSRTLWLLDAPAAG
jgi:6-phosphogluconolactonase